MPTFYLLNSTAPIVGAVIGITLLLIFLLVFIAARYRRCPANKILVIFGKGVGERAARCIHGGGVFVWPIVQDYAYLSLEPITIDIDLTGALSQNNIRVNVPSTFTVGVSTEPSILFSAAERILGLTEQQIGVQTQDIITGQLRLVIATLTIEEINKDREKFLRLINENVNIELNKIGLEVINVNIRDITDESGYINAIGQKAAAEAINAAKVEVAKALRDGDTGEAKATREREIIVSQERASAVEGKKAAERDQRVAVARLDAEAITGENLSKAAIAQRNAELAQAEAEAQRKGDVARAEAEQRINEAQRLTEQAKLEKEEIVRQEINKRKVEIAADADAERARRTAKGEADAVLLRYQAEAEGVRRVLESKAQGYLKLIEACATRPDIAPTLLLIEKLPELVQEQVKAISNLKIDKITVWDNGGGGKGNSSTTAGFLSSMIGSLPAVHELAKQAGIELPGFLGKVAEGDAPRTSGASHKPDDDKPSGPRQVR